MNGIITISVVLNNTWEGIVIIITIQDAKGAIRIRAELAELWKGREVFNPFPSSLRIRSVFFSKNFIFHAHFYRFCENLFKYNK